MATWQSAAYDGRYMRLTITEKVDTINNKSILTWTLASIGGNSAYYTIGNTTVKINGTQVYYKSRTDWDSRVFPAATGSVSGTIEVTHASDGKKTITVEFSTRVYVWEPVEYGGSMMLTNIDRSAPTLTCVVTPVSATSMTIKATASATCDIWEYSTNNGSTWTQYSTTAGATASVTKTELTTGTYNVKVRARKSSNHVYGTSAAVSADITLPTISLAVSNITANSVYIGASSNVNCNIWQYSLNNGSTWMQFSTTNGKSATKTITGLSPNTTYNIKVRARKTSNNLYGTSAVNSQKTLGGSVLNSINAFTIDVSSPVLILNWTVYDSSYTHTLAIKNGSTTILTISGLSGSTGTNNKTHSFTTEQKNSILQAMASIQTLTAKFVLTTYDGSTQVGTASEVNGTIRITNSNPIHGGYTYCDTKTVTSGMTENNQVLIKNQSTLVVTCNGGTGRNYATIAKYRVVIGSKTVESTSTTVNFGTVPVSGTVSMRVWVIDSRGLYTIQTVNIVVLDYERITIDTWSIRRVNEVEAMAQIVYSGTLSQINYNDMARNSLQRVIYRYKRTSEVSWSNYFNFIDTVTSGSQFVYSGNFIEFNPDYSYDLELVVYDKLTSYTIYLVLPKGTPLVAYRAKKVGINKVNPQCALDVGGEIMQNDEGILGFVRELNAEDEDFDNVIVGGIYWYSSSLSLDHAPTDENGFLEVITYGAIILHRFTTVVGTIHLRVCSSDWSDWEVK